jgi:hypothetical protein
MNKEDIEKFLDGKTPQGHAYVKISFKKREAIRGLFVKGHSDYNDLKSKNFWRIVPERQFESFHRTGDIRLTKIFSGTDFSRLTVAKSTDMSKDTL